MIEGTLFTTLSTNEEANLFGGGGKSGGGPGVIINAGNINGSNKGNNNTAVFGDANAYQTVNNYTTKKPKGHH